KFLDVPILMLLLLPGAVFFSSFKILGSFFVGNGQPEKSSYCQFIALIGSAISYPILVPLFGGYGAAAASTAVYFLMYLLIVAMFSKQVAPERPNLFSFGKSDAAWIWSHAKNVMRKLKLLPKPTASK
ncbi:MAG: polysaccharide biosynthesis C-terminal domain-containing protein, partial [Mariniblastus sp.]